MSVCTMTPALVYLSTHKLTNQHARQPVNLSARQHAPRHLINLNPCQLFGMDFNIKRALFVHQPSNLAQKIDSREGLFWCQKGAIVHSGRMYFYLN